MTDFVINEWGLHTRNLASYNLVNKHAQTKTRHFKKKKKGYVILNLLYKYDICSGKPTQPYGSHMCSSVYLHTRVGVYVRARGCFSLAALESQRDINNKQRAAEDGSYCAACEEEAA